MGKKIQLSNKDYGTLIAGIMSNKSQKTMAKELGISVDTVSRILRESVNLNLSPGTSLLTKTDDKQIKLAVDNVIMNNVKFRDYKETGNIDDGVVIVLPRQQFNNENVVFVDNTLVTGAYIQLNPDEYSIGEELEEELYNEYAKYDELNEFHISSLGQDVTFKDGLSLRDAIFDFLGDKLEESEDNQSFEEGQEGYDETDEPDYSFDQEATTEEPEPVEAIEHDLTTQSYTKVTWSASKKYITINADSNIFNADSSHKLFDEIIKLLIDEEYDRAIGIISVKEGIKTYSKGNIVIKDSKLYYKNTLIESSLVSRIVDDFYNDTPFEKYIKFLNNLMLNPSFRAVNRLYDFLEANDIKITDDGMFTAYKVIRGDYTDCHTGTFDNSIGKTVSMPRNMVDEDDNNTCSNGLHICSKSYIKSFRGTGDLLVNVLVNPKDVVAIPRDYSNAKARVCEYIVESICHD